VGHLAPGLLALALGLTRAPRGVRLSCQGRTTKPACHMARPGSWAALHVRLRQDPMVMSRCQNPIRLGPTPRPKGNGSCAGSKSNGSYAEPKTNGPIL